jgi:hypothetical protein
LAVFLAWYGPEHHEKTTISYNQLNGKINRRGALGSIRCATPLFSTFIPKKGRKAQRLSLKDTI